MIRELDVNGGIVVPKRFIIDRRLGTGSKLVYLALLSLDEEDRRTSVLCGVVNRHFTSVERGLNELMKYGYVERVLTDGKGALSRRYTYRPLI